MKLRENLRPNDLVDLVDRLVDIDRYKPKSGEEKDVVVVGFKCDSQAAAQDLGAYIEWSAVAKILDTEIAEAADKDGKYHVYVELTRLPGLSDNILKIIGDVEHITGNQDWKFVPMDGIRYDMNRANLNYRIVQDPRIYDLPEESRQYYQRMKNLTKY